MENYSPYSVQVNDDVFLQNGYNLIYGVQIVAFFMSESVARDVANAMNARHNMRQTLIEAAK